MTRRRRRSIVQSPIQRAKMWDRKMSPSVIATYLEATKQMALERVQQYQAVYQHIVDTVKQILWTLGTETHLVQEYVWYALELWQNVQKYKSNALLTEAEATYLKYLYRGRDRTALREIAHALGIKLSSDSEILARLGVVPVVAAVSLAVLNVRYPEEPVTYVTRTLHQEATPDPGYDYIVYLESIRVTATNPPGSGTTLHFEVVAYLDDGSETSLSGEISIAEGSSYDDLLHWVLDAISSGRRIKSVRLYAYCSAAPASGCEPTLALRTVTGIQMKTG